MGRTRPGRTRTRNVKAGLRVMQVPERGLSPAFGGLDSYGGTARLCLHFTGHRYCQVIGHTHTGLWQAWLIKAPHTGSW